MGAPREDGARNSPGGSLRSPGGSNPASPGRRKATSSKMLAKVMRAWCHAVHGIACSAHSC